MSLSDTATTSSHASGQIKARPSSNTGNDHLDAALSY